MSSLVDLIGASIPLRRSGKRYVGRCPFHGPDKHPSFAVWQGKRKQLWGCWSCGATGDAIDWIMRTRGVEFLEAKRILGEPARPDHAIKRAQAEERRRERAINVYRNRNPDCICPDWLLAI